jgi:hypothetical protein
MSPIRSRSAAPRLTSKPHRMRRTDRCSPRSRGEQRATVEPGATPDNVARAARARGRSRFNAARSAVAVRSRTAPSPADWITVLGGVKGSLAALGGSAALDPACAPCVLAFVDGGQQTLPWAHGVAGSNPVAPTSFHRPRFHRGSSLTGRPPMNCCTGARIANLARDAGTRRR